MNKRKVIFGIVLALVLGLGIYTFANPRNDDTENNDILKPAQEEVQQEQPVTAEPAPAANLPVAAPVVNQLPQQRNETVDNFANVLADAKAAALEELVNYKKDYEYEEANLATYEEIISEYTDKINNSNTVPEVNKNLEDAKKAIDNLIDSDLKQVIDAAKEELEHYNEEELYSEENQLVVDGIKDEGYTALDNAKTKEEVANVLEAKEEEIDEVLKLTDTYFDVTFVGLNGEVVDTQSVLYGDSASEPNMEEVKVLNKVAYAYRGWDKEFEVITGETVVNAVYEMTNIFADVYFGEEKIGSVVLDMNEEMVAIVNDNVSVTKELSEAELKDLVKTKLPVSETFNKKYAFNPLSYVADEGFNLYATEVDDEEAILRHTVVLTYKTTEGAVFANGTDTIESKVITGKNTVSLPDVFKNGKKVNVNWANGNKTVANGDEYTSSATITATIDKVGPEIKLNGLQTRTVYEKTGFYYEEGYSVSDNYTIMSNANVTRVVKFNDTPVNYVDYSKVGTYTIEYSATDGDGNTTTVTRTIIVEAVVLLRLELSKTSGSYNVDRWNRMENITVKAIYNDETRNRVLSSWEYTVRGFDITTVGTRTAVFNYGTAKPAYYTYTVTYSDNQLFDMFKDVSAYAGYDYYGYIEFYGLPKDATVVSIKREDLDAVTSLYKWRSDFYLFLIYDEWDDIRNNDFKTIYITYSIDGQEYTLKYWEQFGKLGRKK